MQLWSLDGSAWLDGPWKLCGAAALSVWISAGSESVLPAGVMAGDGGFLIQGATASDKKEEAVMTDKPGLGAMHNSSGKASGQQAFGEAVDWKITRLKKVPSEKTLLRRIWMRFGKKRSH